MGLSACLSGEIAKALEVDDWEQARHLAGEYGDIFGKGNFFLELQDHGIPEQARLNEQLLRLGAGGRPAARRDERPPLRPPGAGGGPRRPPVRGHRQQPRHAEPDEVRGHRVLPQVGGRDGGALPGPARGPPGERAASPRWWTWSCPWASCGSRTSRCPRARPSRAGCEPSASAAWPAATGRATPELQARLDYELGVINRMGYAGYFLIVADFVRFAREQGIQTTCRGSAPGSIVTYTLGITPVDPIHYQLPFERFLNPDRVTMPDIDVDFEDGRRDEVINYVSRKYGADHVAQIITFGTMLARAAIRDVGRVLGSSYGDVDRIAKAVPNQLGIRLDEALEISPQLKEMYTGDPSVRRIIDFAKQLEGVARNASTHAAGVVISREPLTELMPLQKATNSDATMTQYEMHGIEALGLLKFDFLGLSNLTILRAAVDLIREHRGVEIDLERIPLDDPTDLRAAGLGRDDRRLPAGVGGDAALHPRAPPDLGLRPRGHGRPLPAGPDGQHPGLHPAQARPGEGDLPPPAPRAVPGADLRDLRLPGGHHGRRDRPRRLQRSRGGHAGLRDPQEEVERPALDEGPVRHPGRRARRAPARRSTPSSRRSSPSSATASTRPTPRPTASSPTRRRTSRPTTPSSTWPAC